MKSVLLLLAHFLTTLARLLGPGGLKTVLAENLLIKHQLLVLSRSRQRAPPYHPGIGSSWDSGPFSFILAAFEEQWW